MVASAGAGSSPLAPSGMTISCWMFESVAYTASSVATTSLMNPEFEGVGLEQFPGRGVVDADGVVVAAGDPQSVVGVLVIDADRHLAGNALDERVAGAGLERAAPDGAVDERPDVQGRPVARDAFGLPARRQVDLVGERIRGRRDCG